MTEDEAREYVDGRIQDLIEEALDREIGLPLLIDRFLTYAAAQGVLLAGSTKTIAVFQHAAANIKAGVFDHIDPDAPTSGTTH